MMSAHLKKALYTAALVMLPVGLALAKKDKGLDVPELAGSEIAMALAFAGVVVAMAKNGRRGDKP